MAAVHPGSGYGVLAGVPDDRRHGRRGHRGSGRLCGWPDRRRGCRSVRGGRLRHRRCRVSGRRASSDARPEFGLEADSSAPVLRLPAGGCTAGVPSSLAAGVVLGALIVAVAPLSGAGLSLARRLASLRAAPWRRPILTWGRRLVTGSQGVPSRTAEADPARPISSYRCSASTLPTTRPTPRCCDDSLAWRAALNARGRVLLWRVIGPSDR